MKGLSWLQLEGVLGCLAGQEDFVFLDSSRPDQENYTIPPLYRTGGTSSLPSRRRCGRLSGADRGLAQARVITLPAGSAMVSAGCSRRNLPANGSPDSDARFLADLGVYSTPRCFDHAYRRSGIFRSCLDKAATRRLGDSRTAAECRASGVSAGHPETARIHRRRRYLSGQLYPEAPLSLAWFGRGPLP